MIFRDILQKLQKKVEESDFIISEPTFSIILDFYKYMQSNKIDFFNCLGARQKDFNQSEYFLNVNKDGSIGKIEGQLSRKIEKAVNELPDFEKWFKIIQHRRTPDFLPARWLCHLTGLRHRCAHLFIDLPEEEDEPKRTLIQVRSLSKTDSPGRLDLPVGGHSKDNEDIRQTVQKEMKEELNLELIDMEIFLDKYRIYNYQQQTDNTSLSKNVELRYVYTSTLYPNSLSKIKFNDGEVAGIKSFNIEELKTFLKKFPKQAGSALTYSFPEYLKSNL